MKSKIHFVIAKAHLSLRAPAKQSHRMSGRLLRPLRGLAMTVFFFAFCSISLKGAEVPLDVQGTFILAEKAVLDFLKTETGEELLRQKNLDYVRIAGTVNNHVVRISSEILRDNLGAIVDALGAPGEIILYERAWKEHFQEDRDIYYLVFHEMLRAASYNDDNYVYSKYLRPFPLHLRVKLREAHQENTSSFSYVDRRQHLIRRSEILARRCYERNFDKIAEDATEAGRLMREVMPAQLTLGASPERLMYVLSQVERALNTIERILSH